MKLIKLEYVPIKQCLCFWTWLWFTRDYPYGAFYGEDRENWFRHCGSANRLLIRRRFGITRYHSSEFGFLHAFLFICLVVSLSFVASELLLMWMYSMSGA